MTVKRIYQSDVKVSKEEELWDGRKSRKYSEDSETPASRL